MKRNTRAFLLLIFSVMLASSSPSTLADEQESYGSQVGQKFVNGLANITTAVLEIPKNVINTSNQSNVAYGAVGGLAKGILNTVGRIATGVVDLITVPLPTQPIVQPAYVWDDFDAETTYHEAFRLKEE